MPRKETIRNREKKDAARRERWEEKQKEEKKK